jgi:hypothetical protein
MLRNDGILRKRKYLSFLRSCEFLKDSLTWRWISFFCSGQAEITAFLKNAKASGSTNLQEISFLTEESPAFQ